MPPAISRFRETSSSRHADEQPRDLRSGLIAEAPIMRLVEMERVRLALAVKYRAAMGPFMSR
jgi:hypothetical protein